MWSGWTNCISVCLHTSCCCLHTSCRVYAYLMSFAYLLTPCCLLAVDVFILTPHLSVVLLAFSCMSSRWLWRLKKEAFSGVVAWGSELWYFSCSMSIDARCSMLDAWYLMLDAWFSMFDAWCSMLDARCLIIDIWEVVDKGFFSCLILCGGVVYLV